LRRPIRSLIAPEKGFVTEALPSAMPSINPTSVALAPSVDTRNTGSSACTISDETSMNSETKPSTQTVRGTARQPASEERTTCARVCDLLPSATRPGVSAP